jgi:uncharacterized membrane protein
MSDHLDERLDRFEQTLRELQVELTDLRHRARRPATPPSPTPDASSARVVEAPPVAPRPPRPARKHMPAAVPTSSPARRLGDALGARALAVAGGAVTLLGVVLLFALAVNRGWIGPWQRCAIGAIASTIVFAGGLWLRRRYGPTYSALAAVGAGVGGAYATLVAAAALYHLLPAPLSLTLAGAIAAVATATAIAWSAELIAVFGLVGAMLVPLGVLLDLTVLGTSFVAIMLAAAGTVAVWRRWSWLLAAAVVASSGQIVGLVWQSASGSTRVIALAAVFWVVYLTLAVARGLRTGETLEPLTASLAVFSAGFAGSSAVHLFGHPGEGFALLVVAAAYGAVASGLLVRRTRRDLSSLLWAVALTLAAVSASDLLSGKALAVAWAAEAAVLAWLAVRAREPRIQLGALAYLTLATGHAVSVDAPLRRLFVSSDHPAAGVVSVVAAAAAAFVCAWTCGRATDGGPATGVFAPLEPLFVWITTNQRKVRAALLWTAGVLTTFAVSLGLLELFTLVGSFEWGAVPVTALWAIESGTLLVVGARRRSTQLQRGGKIALGLTLAKVLAYDLGYLGADVRNYSALTTGTILLVAGYLSGREREGRSAGGAAVTSLLAAAVLLVTASVGLLPGSFEAVALLALGTGYAALAASVFRDHRNLATWFWATGLTIVLVGWADLLGGTPRVVAFAGTALILSALARRTGDRRLRLGATATIVLALLRCLFVVAPPRDLFVAGAHPADGAIALAAVAIASAGFAWASAGVRERKPPRRRRARIAYRVDRRARRSAPWLAVVLAVESISLVILQLFEWAGTGSVGLEFQRGQTAVSAFWGVLGLLALYGGLSRRAPRLRRAGFAIFAVSLAKIFLYDLSQLSSVARSLSFLAVGGVLLLGGFFYQRLSGQLDPPNAKAKAPSPGPS